MTCGIDWVWFFKELREMKKRQIKAEEETRKP
jgi:hypothetical protein